MGARAEEVRNEHHPSLDEAIGHERTTITVELTFRLARPDDLEALEWWGLFHGQREILSEALEAQSRGDVVLLVAARDLHVAAQAFLDLRRSPGTGYVWAVRVFPLIEGLGIGRAIMERMERIAAALGCHTLELDVERDNEGARRFYERGGWMVVDTREVEETSALPDGTGHTRTLPVAVMRKTLAPRS